MDRILLVGVVGFAGGIAVRSFLAMSWPAIFVFFLLGGSCLLLWLVRRSPALLVASVLFLAIALGMGRGALAPQHPPPSFAERIGARVELEGRIVADPDIRETTQRITVAVEENRERMNILVVAPLYPEFAYGEQVEVSGTLKEPKPFETEGGRTFRYDRFLAKDGIFAMIEYGRIVKVGVPEGLAAQGRAALFSAKHAFVDGLERSLPEPYASLAAGIITGGKQGLGKDLLDAFIAAGLVHIVVLSGYNVMIVAEAVLRALKFLPKRLAIGSAALTIAAFVLAAGAGAASIRAGLMAGIALFGRASGRTYDALRALVFAGAVMLLANPLLLAFDPGFQLSFVATAGLILGAPIVERWFRFVPYRFLCEIVSATVAAQIAVLPLLLYQTGNFSLVAFPANILVLPAVPLAMLFSFLAGVAGLIAAPIAPIVGVPALALLGYIVAITETAAKLPFAQVIIPRFPFLIVVLLYACLVWIVLRLRKNASTSAKEGVGC